MKRMLSVWLPDWPIARLSRDEPGVVPAHEPFALVDLQARGVVITAVNAVAAAAGIGAGTLLADARAGVPQLRVRPAEKSKDGWALFKLAQWAGRYGPARNHDSEDGFWVDTTGVAHLFGGEENLIADLLRRLGDIAIPALAAIAGTLGAAHALCRFGGRAGAAPVIVAEGKVRAALAPLPVAALRLDEDTVLLLRRLGLKRIGELYDIPRQSLAQRFRSEDTAGRVLLRLDQALGHVVEPLKPFFAPQTFAVRRAFAEPLVSSEALESFVQMLCDELAAALKEKDMGTRALFLALYRADGTVGHAGSHMRAAGNDAAHFKMLLKPKLAGIEAGFGIDLLVLEATRVSPLKSAQPGFGEEAAAVCDAGPLVDRLSNRWGEAAVVRLAPCASHIPERSEQCVAALSCSRLPASGGGGEPQHEGLSVAYEPPWPYGKAPRRPPFLLQRPEPIAVVAEVPDGPPVRFTWRRVERKVAHAEGPERIAPEWWRSIGIKDEAKRPRPRDYFRIEDDHGDAFWVFRHGLYSGEGDEEERAPPRWYLHGLFA